MLNAFLTNIPMTLCFIVHFYILYDAETFFSGLIQYFSGEQIKILKDFLSKYPKWRLKKTNDLK